MEVLGLSWINKEIKNEQWEGEFCRDKPLRRVSSWLAPAFNVLHRE